MTIHVLIAVAAGIGIFVLFLVIARTMNNLVNQLSKMEYLLQRDLEFRKESAEIKRLLELEKLQAERRKDRAGAEPEPNAAGAAERSGKKNPAKS